MKTKPVMKTRIIIELPDHVADALVELSKTIAEAIHSGVARVVQEKLPELKQCQGINNYKTGWYVQDMPNVRSVDPSKP